MQVPVDTESERGLLGIAITNNTKSVGANVTAKTVFLYYTESQNGELRQAVTAIEFMKSSRLGASYQNNIFIGDNNNGNFYFFKLNRDRTGIEVDDIL